MVPGSQNGRTATFLLYGGLKTAKIRKRKTEVTISVNNMLSTAPQITLKLALQTKYRH